MELSYYEYWLSKDIWPASRAVSFIVDHHLFRRSWEPHEVHSDIRESVRNKLLKLMLDEEARVIFNQRSVADPHYNEAGVYIEEQLAEEESDVKPREFLTWLNGHGYSIPYEFSVFISVEGKEPKMTERELNTISKKVCQGIAKTLWDINSKMTIGEMCEHPAILNYGDGKLFGPDTTLHRWLSEVDPREKKTGPKKPV